MVVRSEMGNARHERGCDRCSQPHLGKVVVRAGSNGIGEERAGAGWKGAQERNERYPPDDTRAGPFTESQAQRTLNAPYWRRRGQRDTRVRRDAWHGRRRAAFRHILSTLQVASASMHQTPYMSSPTIEETSTGRNGLDILHRSRLRGRIDAARTDRKSGLHSRTQSCIYCIPYQTTQKNFPNFHVTMHHVLRTSNLLYETALRLIQRALSCM